MKKIRPLILFLVVAGIIHELVQIPSQVPLFWRTLEADETDIARASPPRSRTCP